MSPLIVLAALSIYFGLLFTIAHFTSKNSTNSTFFTGNRQSPWYIVAYGMIGASISGVTFISIPGETGNIGFSYFQLVLGYLLGYFVIATVLMPLYYRLNLISIYSYLGKRFGLFSYKTGSVLFIISQTAGASLRLFLAAGVLQIAFFNAYGIPFGVTVLITILLIWLYTYRSGIKTIVWTDTLQTTFMVLALILSIVAIERALGLSTKEMIHEISHQKLSKIFTFDWRSNHFFFKQFFAGAFIAIVMTGLDQNMMQKNLTCRNIGEAKKNMFTFSLVLVPVNLLFLIMGALLYLYIQKTGVNPGDYSSFFYDQASGLYKNTDDLYPTLAIHYFPLIAGLLFLMGIIAAAFSSADSSITALTTTVCVDLLDFKDLDNEKNRKKRLYVHIGMSALIFLVIMIFKALNDRSVISAVFTVAGYTYGPLLGLFSFGLFTKRSIRDHWIIPIAIIAPILTWVISTHSEEWFFGYRFGFELLILNGLLTFIMLYFSSIGKELYTERD